MTPTNEEIHSSNQHKTSAGSTPLPFVGANSSPAQPHSTHPVLTPMWSDDWNIEAEPSWIHRNLTSHHFKPIFGITDPGLSVVAYSSAYDTEDWSFVAPLVCLTSNVIVFVVDSISSLHSEDKLTKTIDDLYRCGRHAIFAINAKEDACDASRADLEETLRNRYGGDSASIFTFDFRKAESTLRLKKAILIGLLDELKRLRTAHDVAVSSISLSNQTRQTLQTYSQKVDDEVSSSIQTLVIHIMSTEEHRRVFLGHSTPEELCQRLSAYLHLRLLGHIFKNLSLRLLTWMAELQHSLAPYSPNGSLLTFTPSDFFSVLVPLHAWISREMNPRSSSPAYVGAVGTASGATVALGAFAMSLSTPVVVAAASVAAFIGASASYAAPPVSSVLTLPGKSKPTPSDEALRDSILSELASRFSSLTSHHYTELRAAALLMLRRVFVAAQLSTASPASHLWADFATIDENYLDITLASKKSGATTPRS